MKTKIFSLIGFFFGIGIVAFLFADQSISWRDLFARQIRWDWFCALVASSVLYVVSGAWKWQRISRIWRNESPRFSYLFRHTSYAVLWSQLLPLPVATAMQRAAAMKWVEGKTVGQGIWHASYDILFDLGFVGLLFLCSAAQIAWKFGFDIWCALGLIGFVLACVVLVFLPRLIDAGSALLSRFSFGPKIVSSLRDCRDSGLMQPRVMIEMAALGAFRFLLITFRLWLCAKTFGLDIDCDVLFMASPIAAAPSLIPITPGNLGVTEGVWTYLLTLWGVASSSALLFAAEMRLALLVVHAGLAFVGAAANWIAKLRLCGTGVPR
jgi:uncharacterized membrane protein YbhN (UPF0104 family)